MIRSNSLSGSGRRYAAALVLPLLLATGCGGQAPATAPPTGTQAPPAPQPQSDNGTPTVPPTVHHLPSPATPSATPSAPAGSVTLDTSYMPFAAGRSWTYNVRSTANGKTDDGTVTWSVDTANDATTAVTVASNVGGAQHTISNQVTKNADGTVTITSTTDGQTQTQTVKPDSLPSGSQAQGPGAASQGQTLQGTPDHVTVPAGSFDAIKVVNQLPDGKGSITAWYAPQIGMVKQAIEATTDQGPVTSQMELASYK